MRITNKIFVLLLGALAPLFTHTMLEQSNKPIARPTSNTFSLIGSPQETPGQARIRNLVESKQRATQIATGLACCLMAAGYFVVKNNINTTQSSDFQEEQSQNYYFISVGARYLYVTGFVLMVDGIRPFGPPMIGSAVAHFINNTGFFLKNLSDMIE